MWYNDRMEYSDLGGIRSSRLVLGCMRIADKPLADVERLLDVALELGVNTLDNADIYGGGTCESMIGDALKAPSLRGKFVLQTKCGICSGKYDLSRKHIIESVEGSLRRLRTDSIDILLLHRPDTLMRPHEVAQAFDELQKSGKVKVFGVSNFSAQQVDYLQSVVNQKLYVNQLQMSPTYCPLIDFGINVNTPKPEACDRDGGALEYCRKNGVTIQTYGTVQCSFTDENGFSFSGAIFAEPAKKKYFSLDFTLRGLAQKYGVTPDAIAIKWILHHPADMQAIVGTTSAERMLGYKDCCSVPLTDTEWYEIYRAAGHTLP